MAGSKVYAAFVIIAFGGLLFGYIIGINSNVVTNGQMVCEDDWDGAVGDWTSVGYNQCWRLSPLEKGFLSSLNLIGACLASLVCFRFADDMGRKLEVQLGAALYFLGATLCCSSPVLWGIYVGFFVYGLGIGFAMHAAPVYIAEISPAEIRGTLVSAKEAIIVLGMFLGFLFGWLFGSYAHVGWRFMVMMASAFALLMEIGIVFVPQSPRYLVLKAARTERRLLTDNSAMQEALVSMSFFRQHASQNEVETEVRAIMDDVASSAVATGSLSWTDAFGYKRPLLIGCGIVFLQQVTGQPSVLYFATNIFKSAGFQNGAALSSTGVGLVKLLATLFTVWRVDLYGRRFLLFTGIIMMTVGLMTLSLAFFHQTCELPNVSVGDCPEEALSLPQGWAIGTVAALCLYVSGYQVGFGPIAWLLISEVFPLTVRGSAMSLAAITNFAANIMMTLTLELVQKFLTPAGNFIMYTCLSVLSLCFVYFIVPETKGKTLEQVEAMLARKASSRAIEASKASAA